MHTKSAKKPQYFLKNDCKCSNEMLSEVISSFKKKLKKKLQQEQHRSGMFYLQFLVFIIYLYYLALLSALQTRQKHSQWRYADSAPFVETQAEDHD